MFFLFFLLGFQGSAMAVEDQCIFQPRRESVTFLRTQGVYTNPEEHDVYRPGGIEVSSMETYGKEANALPKMLSNAKRGPMFRISLYRTRSPQRRPAICTPACKNGGSCVAWNTCNCPDGFTTHDCSDLDECATANGGCSHTCVNSEGSYECQCPDGFTMNEDQRSCNDLDECAADNGGCSHTCVNSEGSYVCQCPDAFTLNEDQRSCDEPIDCGPPTSIANGHVSYTTTRNGSTAIYSCDMHYNLTDGSQVRLCQTNSAWGGKQPNCDFVNHCATSTPCQNGATCTDLLDDYECMCAEGWSGRDCDGDNQSPVMSECPADMQVYATESTKYVEWTPPVFKDPFGNGMDFTNNYPDPSYDFPWGDFVVQYTATKRNNGLSTECAFRVRVRPTPCEELNVPMNGSRICNNWRTEYGRFCLVACKRDYMISPPYSFGTLYACGATGNWIAADPAPDCDVTVADIGDTLYYHPEFLKYSYEDSCTDTNNLGYLQEMFIERMCGAESGFKQFCSAYPLESVASNVEVVC